MTGTNGDSQTELEEFVEFLHDNGIDGIEVVGFLAKAHRFSAELIRYLARNGDDNARAHLSEAQADTSDATAAGYDEILGASGEVGDPQGPGPQ